MLSYLAAPYSDNDPEVIAQRMDSFCKTAAQLTVDGKYIVSPLFNHFILEHANLPGNWGFWATYSKKLMNQCDELIIITMDGWTLSSGVMGELQLARELGIPFVFIDPVQ